MTTELTAPVKTSRVDATAIIPGTQLAFAVAAELSRTFYSSGLLTKSIKSAGQAFAIIVAGAELGLPPMQSLRSVAIIDGRMVVAADVQLSAFKKSGGRAEFKHLDDTKAVLFLQHPNGDVHTETYTIQMAEKASLLFKDNWKKHPSAMLRSRAITAGLKSLGWELSSGVYDPDELSYDAPAHVPPAQLPVKTEVVEDVEVNEEVESPKDEPAPEPVKKGAAAKLKNALAKTPAPVAAETPEAVSEYEELSF